MNAPYPADGSTSCFYSTLEGGSNPEDEGLLQKVETVVKCEEEMLTDKNAAAIKGALDDQGSGRNNNSTGWTGPAPSKASSDSPRRVPVGHEQRLNVTFFRKGNATDTVDYGVAFKRNHSDVVWIGQDFVEGAFSGPDYTAKTVFLTFRLRDSVANGQYVNIPFAIWDGPGGFHKGYVGFVAQKDSVNWMLVIMIAIGIGLLVVVAVALGRRKK